MESYILQTLSGASLDFSNPDKSAIVIEDIAHSLSYLCRFNGHSKYFYSVAQHSLLVYLYAKNSEYCDSIQLCALLHDAQEAYVCDLPTPLKRMLSMYVDVEKKVQHSIFSLYGITEIFQKNQCVIKYFDDEITRIERRCLLDKLEPDDSCNQDVVSSICERAPVLVKKEFISTAKDLLSALKGEK